MMMHSHDIYIYIRNLEEYFNIFDIKKFMIKCEAELQEAIDIQHTDVPVTFSDFLTWITRNAFQECLLLNSETWLQKNHENPF